MRPARPLARAPATAYAGGVLTRFGGLPRLWRAARRRRGAQRGAAENHA